VTPAANWQGKTFEEIENTFGKDLAKIQKY